MNNRNYPKVLIFGQSFNLKTGGGITKANLFKNWPFDKIAVATPEIDPTGAGCCKIYYRIGNEETERPWPFSLIQPKYLSRPVYLENSDEQKKTKNFGLKKSKYNPVFKQVFNFLLHFFGIYYFIFRLRISDRFLAWLDEYNPDIIYTQLAKLEYMKFINDLLELRKIPVVIHIMDDWPAIINQPGLFSIYWGYIINKSFRKCLDNASLLMSICKAMSDEYIKKYNKEFLPFHNTIDWNKWEPSCKKDYTITGSFKILYAGRIGRGISKSVYAIIKAVKYLTDNGLNIEFQLQTTPGNLGRLTTDNFRFLKINPFLPYKDLPGKFSSVDLLVLPMDFNKHNLSFIHLSMPTKVPEYMASGTPIFVFAHESTALYKYALNSKWAFTCCKNKIHSIAQVIEKIYKDMDARKTVASTALKIVRANHDSEIVRNKFRKALLKCLQ